MAKEIAKRKVGLDLDISKFSRNAKTAEELLDNLTEGRTLALDTRLNLGDTQKVLQKILDQKTVSIRTAIDVKDLMGIMEKSIADFEEQGSTSLAKLNRGFLDGFRSDLSKLEFRLDDGTLVHGYDAAISQAEKLIKVNAEQAKSVDNITAKTQDQIKTIDKQRKAQEKLNDAEKAYRVIKSNHKKIKIREFENDAYDEYQENYRQKHDGGSEYLEDTIDIVRKASEYGTKFSADMTTSCSRLETAIRRFFSALDPNQYPEITSWADGIIESVQNKYFKDVSRLNNGLVTGEYSWGVEAVDEDRVYFYINLLDVAKEKEQEFSAYIEAESKKRDEGLKKEQELYTSIGNKYKELSKLRDNSPDYNYSKSSDKVKSIREIIGYYEQEKILIQDILNLQKEFSEIPGKYKTGDYNISYLSDYHGVESVSDRDLKITDGRIKVYQENLVKAIEKQKELTAAIKETTKAKAEEKGVIKETALVSQQENEQRIINLQKIIKNQEAWIKYLNNSLDESNFKTSGKREATEQLRYRTKKLVQNRQNNYEDYYGEYPEEMVEVAWMQAYKEAEKQGVAESTLSRYDTDAKYAYESNLKVLNQEYEVRSKLLRKHQEELALLQSQPDNLQKVTGLIGSLKSKYGEESFNNIFGKTISDFGTLDNSNAAEFYDVLIAKANAYKKEQEELAQKMQIAGQETQKFIEQNGELATQYSTNTEFMIQYGNLMTQISSSTLTAAEATEQLNKWISQNVGSSEADILTSIGDTSQIDDLQQKISSLKDFTQSEMNAMMNGIDLDKFFKDLGVPADQIDELKNKFIDLMKVTRDTEIFEVSDINLDAVLDGFIDDCMKSGRMIKENAKYLQEFRKHMSGKKLKYDKSIKAEYGDDWKAVYGLLKNELRSTGAAPADTLMKELVELFPDLFSESDLALPVQDQFKKIVDIWTKARAEFKIPDTELLEIPNQYRDIMEINASTVFAQAGSNLSKYYEAARIEEEKLLDVAENVTKQIEHQTQAEENAAQAAKDNAAFKKEQEKIASNISDHLNKQSLKKDSGETKESAQDIIEKDIDDALSELRNAANNQTTLFNFKGVFDSDDLLEQLSGMAQSIGDQANFTVQSVQVKDSVATVRLYNDELKLTVDQTYKLTQASKDAEATLKLTGQSFKQNVKALNENTFDTEGFRARAVAAVEKVRSSLHGLEYDLTALEDAAGNISSKEDFTKFNNQLKAAQDNIQAIKNATVSKSSMNQLANMQRDMQNANIELETMRIKLQKIGDIDGVSDARKMIDDMAASMKEFNNAKDAQGQQEAYSKYSSTRSSFKAQLEYLNAVKSLGSSSSKQSLDDPIKQQYKSLLDLTNKINSINNDILKYQEKDAGTGLFSGYIKQLQSDKEKLVAELDSITQEINNRLSSGFVQGKEYSIPSAKFITDNDAVSSFLNDTKTQAALTTEEINKLVVALQNAQKIDVQAAAKVVEQFKSVQATYKQITSLTTLDTSNPIYKGAGNIFAQIMDYKNKLSSDPTSWTPEESANLQELINKFNEYGNVLVQVGQKEAQYFSGKTRYVQDTTMYSMAEDAKKAATEVGSAQQKLTEAAQKFAQESGAGGAIITNFTKSADGISKLDFSVFDTASNSMRTFTMEMGSVTDGVFVAETSISKSLANIKAAQNQLQSVGGLIGRLSVSGVDLGESTSAPQVQRLLELYRLLGAELSKGENVNQNLITKLTKDSKLAATEVEKLYRQSQQLQSSLMSGDVTKIGNIDGSGNIYSQMSDQIRQYAESQGYASVEIGKFNAKTNTLDYSLVHANGTVQIFRATLDSLNGTVVTQQTGVKKLTSQWDVMKSSITKAGKRFITAFAGANIFYKVISEVRKGVSYVKEIDLAMTELKKVTNETEASYNSFLSTASKTAGAIGSTVSDFTEATANFARLGYTMEESAKMAETAIVYKNVADGLDTVEESTESIISTMKAFGIESDDTMSIIDRFNEVGNNFAITSAGIGEALQRSASALFAAGNTIDESIGLVTAANSVIQNPEQVGTALKTLSLRIRGVKTELEDAGLETEGMAETTAQLQDKLKALTHGKVDIMLDADTFKNTTQILREMSEVWDEMNDMERAAALELIGGKRQANILASLITNFETVENVIETSMNSAGSAIAENEKVLDSIQGKTDQFTNSLQSMWNNALDSEVIKGFLDLGIGLVKVIDKFGLLKSTLAGVMVYFAAFKKITPVSLFKEMIAGIKNYASVIQKVNLISSAVPMAGSSAILDANAVNAYANAVTHMSMQQQAAILTSNGLTKAQAAQVLIQNGAEESTVRRILGIEALNAATMTNTQLSGLQVLSTLKQTNADLSQNAVNFLLAHSNDQITKSMLAKAVAAGIIEHKDAALILKSGMLTASNYAQAMSWKSLGVAIKTAFMSNPVGFILTIATTVASILIPIISRATTSTKELTKTANEAINKYKETQSTLRDHKQTIDELSASYERLSKGVDLDTNENINLTTSSYQEYLDICNDIADMYPNLVAGYDAQGNAILSLKGNVDELIQSYKEAAQAARQKVIASGGDIFSAFKTTYDSDPSTTFGTTGLVQQIKLAEKLQELISSGTQDEINEFFNKLNSGNIEIDGQKYSNVEFDDLVESSGLDEGFYKDGIFRKSEIDIEAFRQQSNKLLSFIKSATTAINTETSKVKTLMDAYLNEDLDYAALSEKSRGLIGQIVASFDAEFINGFENADSLYNWIKTNIVGAFQDESVINAINDLSNLQLEFEDGIISYADYKQELDEYIAQIQNKVDEDALAQIKIGIGIDEESLQTSINHVIALLGGNTGYLSTVSSLSIEDLKIAGQLEVPDGTILSWQQLQKEIEAAKIAATKDFDITNYTQSISGLSAVISEYQEAIQKLDKGSFTMDDFMDLIEKYPDLAKGVDISSNAFYGLSRNLNRAIKTSTKSFVRDLKELKASLIAAGKSTDSIDQLIEAVENMPDDALDDIIQKYSTLADKIREAKTAQDKLTASMEENPNEGYETRGEAMEYMKEAMKNGEIGSESNLWNVAEKYGFTYDSAKTINENADALAKFIATRERWFKTADDGDDRTKDDGYSYEGTENFIEDVESAVKNNAELQQYLTWDYDESTGTLNFDFKNKNWDTIVSILSKTKELAGLTSDEFSDLMIQVGQYFGIDWGNYDDAVDHLNEIANGTDDAKTKTEEYGKYMQDYFGKNTEIDLTARPMVSGNKMQESGWVEFEEGDYATVYSGSYSSDDDSVTVSVTPILPDGNVLDPKALEKYATEIANGTDPAEVEIVYKDKDGIEKKYTGEDIFLNRFEGANKEEQASQYGTKLSEAQAGYDALRDTLGVNAALAKNGIDGLKDIAELQGIVETNSKGVTVINEDAFRSVLTGAEYTEDQIDIIIDQIKKLNKEAFNIDTFKIDDTLETTGVAGLKEIQSLQSAIKEDSDTGLTVFDTDMFTSVLKEAGYTEDQIDSLIKKIQEYNGVVSVSGNTDPLGLSSASFTIDSLKASLGALGIKFDETIGTWFDGKKDLTINVTDLVTTLKAKGWTDQSIKDYITKLSNDTNLEGFNVKVKGIENIDEVIKTANEVPTEKQTEYEVTGSGAKTVDGIVSDWRQVPTVKKTKYEIDETTTKTTVYEEEGEEEEEEPSLWERIFGGGGGVNGTAHLSGTANANGSWGAPKTETSLVGELGPELLVRGNRWTTVGENGAEFTQVKKGDIIFNH